MIKLEMLRKTYSQLRPFERATMRATAYATKNEPLFNALVAPSFADDCRATRIEYIFLFFGAFALHQSQNADALHHESKFQAGLSLKAGKADECAAWMADAEIFRRRRICWLIALEQLDRELGSSCMAFVRLIANVYCQEVFEEVDGDRKALKASPECSSALRSLRKLWNCYARNNPGVPNAKGKAAGAEDD